MSLGGNQKVCKAKNQSACLIKQGNNTRPRKKLSNEFKLMLLNSRVKLIKLINSRPLI
jgi:hypothetical protein